MNSQNRDKLCTGQSGSSYFGAVDSGSEARILRPASVYFPKRRTVAIASKETGTHIPPSYEHGARSMNRNFHRAEGPAINICVYGESGQERW